MTPGGPHTVIIRADASPAIGGGHVMRCLTLADVLIERGARVTFACRPEAVATVPALARSAHRVVELMGAPEDEPAQMARACDGATEVLIVDHYAWSARQETACRAFAKRIVVIDDLANRTHDCDLLLDQNLGRRAGDYRDLVPAHAQLLIGPAYALLRPEFARARPAALARRAEGGSIRRILVSMGLTDAANATAAALAALTGMPEVMSGTIAVRIVLGRAAPHLAAIEATASRMREAGADVAVRIEPADMAAEMAAADLCIGAGGSSSWERCCLGLPTVVVVTAENQRAGAQALAKAGAAMLATDMPTVSAAIAHFIVDRCALTSMALASADVADGQGTSRVAGSLQKLGLRISVVCSSQLHPIWPVLNEWRAKQAGSHEVELVENLAALRGGDVLFLVSCTEIVPPETRARYSASLVLHASDLPEGRGWSPHVWQILQGKSSIAVSLLEAADPVDSGPIWAQQWVQFEGHELYDEINSRLFEAELSLMDQAVAQFGRIKPSRQDERDPSYYRRRHPEDSRIDPGKTIAEQFDLLRVCDSSRYPAFFEFRGKRYRLRIEKMSD
jgi:UDP-2,4-diacetamido-2,4,6-trideoxy-beta-L-altropyranose hydrolase